MQLTSTPVAATVSAASTQAAPTVQAEATRVAPTVSAAETQVVPTINAVVTAILPTVSAGETATANSAVRITSVQLAPSDPTITMQNNGTRMVDLSAWTLQVGDSPVKLPPNTEVAPGTSLVLHATSGTSNGTNVYLGGSLQTALNTLQPGEHVMLQNPSGSTVARFTVPGA